MSGASLDPEQELGRLLEAECDINDQLYYFKLEGLRIEEWNKSQTERKKSSLYLVPVLADDAPTPEADDNVFFLRCKRNDSLLQKERTMVLDSDRAQEALIEIVYKLSHANSWESVVYPRPDTQEVLAGVLQDHASVGLMVQLKSLCKKGTCDLYWEAGALITETMQGEKASHRSMHRAAKNETDANRMYLIPCKPKRSVSNPPQHGIYLPCNLRVADVDATVLEILHRMRGSSPKSPYTLVLPVDDDGYYPIQDSEAKEALMRRLNRLIDGSSFGFKLPPNTRPKGQASLRGTAGYWDYFWNTIAFEFLYAEGVRAVLVELGFNFGSELLKVAVDQVKEFNRNIDIDRVGGSAIYTDHDDDDRELDASIYGYFERSEKISEYQKLLSKIRDAKGAKIREFLQQAGMTAEWVDESNKWVERRLKQKPFLPERPELRFTLSGNGYEQRLQQALRSSCLEENVKSVVAACSGLMDALWAEDKDHYRHAHLFILPEQPRGHIWWYPDDVFDMKGEGKTARATQPDSGDPSVAERKWIFAGSIRRHSTVQDGASPLASRHQKDFGVLMFTALGNYLLEQNPSLYGLYIPLPILGAMKIVLRQAFPDRASLTYEWANDAEALFFWGRSAKRLQSVECPRSFPAEVRIGPNQKIVIFKQ